MRELKMKTKPFAKGNETVVTYATVSYNQDVEGGQDLHINTESTDSDMFFSFKTSGWSFNNIQEVIDILEDFKKRSGV